MFKNSKINEISFEKYYKVLVILILFPMLVPFIHVILGKFVKIVLFIGIAICIVDIIFISRFKKIKDSVNLLLVLFALFYLVSILVNRNSNLEENIKQWCYMSVFFYLLFMIDKFKNPSCLEKEIIDVSWVIVIFSFFLSTISLSMFVFNISEWYIPLESGLLDVIGVYSGRLAGLYNANTCGIVSLVSIVLSVYLLRKNKSKIFCYIFLIVNLLVEFLTIILSGSRASIFSLIFISSFVVFYYFVFNFKVKNCVFKVLCAFLLAVVFAICLSMASLAITKLAPSLILVDDVDAENIEKDTVLENVIESLLSKAYENTTANRGSITFCSRSIVLSFTGIKSISRNSVTLFDSNGRFEIWDAAISSFLQSPFVGLTREGLVQPIVEILKANNTEGYLDATVVAGGIHNLYLTVLVSSGVLGFIVFIGVLVVVLFKTIKELVLAKNINDELLFSFMLIAALLMTEFFENRILYQVNAINAIFWIYFGYLYYFVRTEQSKRKTLFSKE